MRSNPQPPASPLHTHASRRSARLPCARHNVLPPPPHTHTCARPQAQRFAPGAELLRADPSDACDKLRLALKVLGGFKSHYFSYRAASAGECPDNPWRFQNAAVFARLDRWGGAAAAA